MAPDLRRKVDAHRAARIAQEQTMKRQIDAQVCKRPTWFRQEFLFLPYLYAFFDAGYFRAILTHKSPFGQTDQISRRAIAHLISFLISPTLSAMLRVRMSEQ